MVNQESTRVFSITAAMTFLVVVLAVWVATPTCVQQPPSVQLPSGKRARNLGKSAQDLSVTLRRDGGCFVHQVAVECRDLPEVIRPLVEWCAERRVVLRADRRLPYAKVRAAIRNVQEGGIERLAFEFER